MSTNMKELIEDTSLYFESMDDDELANFEEERGYSRIMVAAETGQSEVVEHLIERGENLDFEVEGQTAASLAFANGHHGIVLSLIKANAKYPKNYKHEEASDELKYFVNLSLEMHEKVKNYDEENEESLKDAKDFIHQNAKLYPDLRHFFDISNISLLKTAMVAAKFKVYKIILALNIVLGSHESVDNIRRQLNDTQKLQLRDIHEELSTNIFTDEMMILMGNCKLGPGVTDHGFYIEFIRKAFDFLFKIPLVALILKVVAARREFKIIFDFERDSVQFLVPTTGSSTNGIFFHSGKIYIAAKDMLVPEKELNVYAVMAHELCHFAMFLTYENRAKPYKIDNLETKLRFNQISQECKGLKKFERLISLVFDVYGTHMHHAELIVRIPHMLVEYFEDKIYLSKMRKTFLRLFEFYEENVMSEMERELPKLQEKNDQNSKLKKENEELKDKIEDNESRYNWIFFIMGLVVVFAGIVLFHIFYSPTYSWSGLSNEKKIKFKNVTVNFHGVDMKFGELFPDNSSVYEDLPSEHLKYGLKGKSQALTKVIMTTYRDKIFLTYLNMPESLRKVFVEHEINFQGKKIKIKNVLDNFDALTSLNSFEILEIFDGRPVNISSKTELKANFYVERFFVVGETQLEPPKMYKNVEIIKFNPVVKNFNEILSEISTKKVFLLSSPAGEGKSTTLRHFAIELKNKSPENWIQFVDLKKHFEAYKKGVKINLKNPDELLNFLTSNLLKLNELESEIFEELFRKNRVTFLWDGIDEISPLYKDFMLDLTSTIKSSTNCPQLISTRPQHQKELIDIFQLGVHTLVPMEKSRRTEFIIKTIAGEIFHKNVEKFWGNFLKAMPSLNLNPSLEFYKEHEEIFLLVEKAQNILNPVDKEEDLITNPLLLHMIAEILSEESISENYDLNLFSIYDKFIDKKLKIVQIEKGEVVGQDPYKILRESQLNFTQIHQAFAIRLLITELLNDDDRKDFNNLQILSSISSLSKDQFTQISRFGIIDVQTETNFTFLHRSFAEFYLAQFLIEKFKFFDITQCQTKFWSTLTKSDVDIQIFILSSVLFGDKFHLVRKFITSYYKIDNIKSQDIETFNNALNFYSIIYELSSCETLKHVLIEFLENDGRHVKIFKNINYIKNELSGKIRRRFLGSEVKEEDMSFSEMLFTDVLKTTLKYHGIWPKNHLLRSIFLPENKFNETSLMMATKLKEIEVLWRYLNDNWKSNEKRQILLMNSKFLETALHYSMWNKDPNYFLYMKYIYSEYFSPEEIRNILIKTHEDFLPFVWNIIYGASLETALEVSKYLKILFENEKLKLRKLLSHRDSNGSTIYSWFYKEKEYEEKLNIFIELLNETFNDHEEFVNYLNFLQWDIKAKNLIFFNKISLVFTNLKVLQIDFESLRYLRWSSGDFEFFLREQERLRFFFGSENLERIFLLVNAENKTILHELLQDDDCEVLTEPFLELMSRTLNQTQVKKLIFAKFESNETLLMWVAKLRKSNILKEFWNLINKNLKKEEKRELLNVKQKHFWTTLQLSTLNEDPYSFIFMKKIYEETFNQEETRNILLKTHKGNVSFIYHIISESSLETALEVSKYLEDLFSGKKVELGKLLLHASISGNSIFNSFKDKKMVSQKVKIFTELFRKTLDIQEEQMFDKFLAFLELDVELEYPNVFYRIGGKRFKWSRTDLQFFLNNFESFLIFFGPEPINKVLMSTDDQKWPLLHQIINNEEDLMEIFLTKLEKTLSVSELIDYISIKTDNEEIPLMGATLLKFERLIVFWNFVSKVLRQKEERRKILLIEQKYSLTSLQYSAVNKDPKTFLFMKEIYNKYLTPEEIRYILLKTREDKPPFIKNVIDYASSETALEVSKYLKHLFKDHKAELNKLLSYREWNGIFNDIKGFFNQNLEIFKNLYNFTQ